MARRPEEFTRAFSPERMMLSDISEVVALEQSVSPTPWSKTIFTDCLKAGYECWVLRSPEVFGYLILASAAQESHLLNIAIHPDSQGRGFGSSFLEFAISLAAKEGADRLFLEVRPSNSSARALYQKKDFRFLGRRPNYYGRPAKEDALVLSLEFKPD
ncbi:MAG: ribosomal protein S18-alanine N-acetyltransferase [Proteobacteria bacterium]|jgi:ribosomal-protein-alanine N-acetyltransferase|nr:ribosomal protein S18-alanine N-acetyltransferase [Pseudomonadota bacterium]MBT6069615.1 ribosomal protein S18-alanine N-acetyltransferase [Pseudomonadota bacterium]MBT7109487.1 ribosomal protein S18-alanine N-acetyltransferase [Pseudomonadota bacterium]MBT7812302.1 ribosomal protein S18-alanine N-acetyltransferase [Pseudomonadota bacterium]